jgi:S1/P1 Nuclease
MYKHLLKWMLIVALTFYFPIQSWAWGMLGHRIVGQIAESYLTPKARREIQKILGTESVAMASNWADFIKSDTNYKYLNSWHYADFEKDLNEQAFRSTLKNDTATDAYTRLQFLIKALRNRSLSMDKKRMYLRLLIHIVGDLHQPLHVSATGDEGGNNVKVVWFGQPSNLHRVWDEQLIMAQELSYTEYAAAINHASPKQRVKWQKQPITQWFFEAYELSNQLHREIHESNQKLSYLYIYDHLQTLNDQLVKGGVRLAGLLNQIFG